MGETLFLISFGIKKGLISESSSGLGSINSNIVIVPLQDSHLLNSNLYIETESVIFTHMEKQLISNHSLL